MDDVGKKQLSTIRKNTSRNKIFYEWGNSIFVSDDEWFVEKFSKLDEICCKQKKGMGLCIALNSLETTLKQLN